MRRCHVFRAYAWDFRSRTFCPLLTSRVCRSTNRTRNVGCPRKMFITFAGNCSALHERLSPKLQQGKQPLNRRARDRAATGEREFLVSEREMSANAVRPAARQRTCLHAGRTTGSKAIAYVQRRNKGHGSPTEQQPPTHAQQQLRSAAVSASRAQPARRWPCLLASRRQSPTPWESQHPA